MIVFLDLLDRFFIAYLLLYATFLFVSVFIGSYKMFEKEQLKLTNSQIKHSYYLPVSLLVPAYNEEVTIVDSIRSLLKLDYKLYEIIIIDDGSKDNTVQVLLDAFDFKKTNRPIPIKVKCKPQRVIYETTVDRIHITLISKENGGKGDSLNMGINASRFPYFICMDADSFLQKDSLEKIIRPVMENPSIVAIGGLIRIAQCVVIRDSEIVKFQMPKNLRVGIQVVEYCRTFLASRILKDLYGGNLIISGAFGLFKKDIVVAVGGYDSSTLGEDMELVVKMHVFCRNNHIKYKIAYEPDAVCWSQAPGTLKDLMKQRRRWHLGLFQCMYKYRCIFANLRFGLLSFVSYLYYLLFELLSPFVEILGLIAMLLSYAFGLLNAPFFFGFFILYSLFGTFVSLTAFFQRVYIGNVHIRFRDGLLAFFLCILENFFFHYVLAFVRITAFVGYKKKKHSWGSIQRVKQEQI